jgi:hypothetical protein
MTETIIDSEFLQPSCTVLNPFFNLHLKELVCLATCCHVGITDVMGQCHIHRDLKKSFHWMRNKDKPAP